MRFEEPAPQIPRTPERLQECDRRLRLNPDQWALLGKIDSTERACRQFAYELRQGKCEAFGAGFEIVCRYLFEEFRIYARYVGGDR